MKKKKIKKFPRMSYDDYIIWLLDVSLKRDLKNLKAASCRHR